MAHLVLRLACGIAATFTVGLAFSGCGAAGGPAKKPCYPTKGQLFVKSQPANGAQVILHPQGGESAAEWFSGFPHGKVESDGSFELETYGEKDGAPAGEYVVLVTWPTASDPSNEEAPTQDRLGGRYADPGSSQFKVKVDSAPTTLPPIKIP